MFSDKPSNCNLRKQDRDLSYLLNLNEGVGTLEGGFCRYTIGLNIRVSMRCKHQVRWDLESTVTFETPTPLFAIAGRIWTIASMADCS